MKPGRARKDRPKGGKSFSRGGGKKVERSTTARPGKKDDRRFEKPSNRRPDKRDDRKGFKKPVRITDCP